MLELGGVVINRISVLSSRLLILGFCGVLASCGASNPSGEASSSSSSSSSSTSSGQAAEASVSTTSSLDWDWKQSANTYCAEHQSVTVVPGPFNVLRPETSQTMHSSEHFVMRWNSDDNVNISQATIDKALNTFEDVWDFYIHQLNFPEPYWDTATKYKVSVNVSDQGYASGAGTGERDPEMWVHYDALGHVGTLAHEFAHTLQYTTRSMRDSQYVGWLWESHANWMAHQYNPEDVQCTEALVNAPHIYYGSTRNRYCNWQFFEFIKDNSCPEFLNDALWTNGIQPEDPAHGSADPFTTLAANAAWTTSELNDIFADWALHNAHWDYQQNGKTYLKNYGSNHSIDGARRFRVSRLLPTGKNNQYEIPNYWSPQRWGYNLVELLPEPGRDHIWIDFEGIIQESSSISQFRPGFKFQPDEVGVPNSSWRWSAVVTQTDGSPRYSEIRRGANGRLRVDLKSNDKSVWLVVMATPTEIQKIFWDQIYYSIYRYPWRIVLDGAKPAQFQDSISDSELLSGAPHINGGGWVAATAEVGEEAYVGPNAKVLGEARVVSKVRVEGHAVVSGSAFVGMGATVKDYALVTGTAVVDSAAVIEGHAAVLGGLVKDQSRVGALSIIDGSSTEIRGHGVVLTTMNTVHTGVDGTVQLIGDVELNTRLYGDGVFYGYVDSVTAGDSELGADRTEPEAEVTQATN